MMMGWRIGDPCRRAVSAGIPNTACLQGNVTDYCSGAVSPIDPDSGLLGMDCDR